MLRFVFYAARAYIARTDKYVHEFFIFFIIFTRCFFLKRPRKPKATEARGFNLGCSVSRLIAQPNGGRRGGHRGVILLTQRPTTLRIQGVSLPSTHRVRYTSLSRPPDKFVQTAARSYIKTISLTLLRVTRKA